MTFNATDYHCGPSTQGPGGQNMQRWSPNITFLFNLVLSDFLLLLNLPFRIDNYWRGEKWIFGDASCRINLFMLAVNRSSSIAFMTTVAVDRYFKVVHPHHRINHMCSKQAGWVVCFIWVLVISLRIPLLASNLHSKSEENISFCRSFSNYEKPPLGIRMYYVIFTIDFFLPLVLLVFCSIRIACNLRSRKMNRDKRGQRAIRTVLVIVGVFVLCFFPGIGTGLTTLYFKSLGKDYCNAYHLTGELFSISIAFTYLNSALDPVIYCFSSSILLNYVKQALNRTRIVQLNLSRQGSMQNECD